MNEHDLLRQRELVVRNHIEAENRGDIAESVGTFGKPFYDMVPMTTYDGPEAVAGMLELYFTGFPDLHQEIVTLRHAGDVVILEVRNTGTHKGEFLGVAPAGGRMDMRSCNIMRFEGADLVGETIYFDSATLMRQISPASC